MGGAGWDVTDAGGTAYRSRPPQQVGGGNGYVFRYVVSSILPFSSSRFSYYWVIYFFVMIEPRQFGMGPDRTDTVGDRHAGQDGGETTGAYDVIFVLYSINFFLLTFLLFQLSTYSTITDGAGRDVTGPTRAA